jgi:hypothetical protein
MFKIFQICCNVLFCNVCNYIPLLHLYVNIKIYTYSNIFIVNVLFLFEKRLQRRHENENKDFKVLISTASIHFPLSPYTQVPLLCFTTSLTNIVKRQIPI